MYLHDQDTTSTEKLKPVISTTILLVSVMVEQPNIQAVISSIETFDCTKSKFESWKMSVENTAHILGPTIFHIAFSKMVGLLLMSACRLRDSLPHLTWDNLKNELLRLYATIPFDSHATKVFGHLKQGPDDCSKFSYIMLVNFFQRFII